MQRIIRNLIVYVVFAATLIAQTSQTISSALDEDLSRTLGFILGQNLTLNRIKTQYPDLEREAQSVQLEFKLSFGNAEEGIRAALQALLKDKYSDFVALLENRGLSALSSQPLSREMAVAFLSEVESRAKGRIPSPILETLLIYEFENSPAEEFARGYTRIFRTKDHPKAKGIDFQIRYPGSWRPKEGERQNIIQTFTSKNGHGLESLLLLVKDIPFPPGYQITKQDLDELFTEHELKEMIPDSARFISAKPVMLDGHKGGMILYDQTMQRLDLTLTMRNLLFVTIRGRKMIFVQCMVSAMPGKETGLQERFNRSEALFKMIANSFVIQEQYR